MNASFRAFSLLHRQHGAASVAIAMLLMFILAAAVAAVLNMSGSSVMDAAKNEEQVAALFLAESGLERGQKVVTSTNPITNLTCTGIGGGPYFLGRGGFTLAGTSQPTICDSSGATPCTRCVLQSTGYIGPSFASHTIERTIERSISLTTLNGVACNRLTAVPDCSNLTAVAVTPPTIPPTWVTPPTWSLTLQNNFPNTAVALFHLAATRQGNPTGGGCTPASNCSLQWNINSQNGAQSVLSMGNLYTIVGGGTSQTVYQTVSSSQPEDAVEVGVLFPGTATPIVAGAYWNDTNSGSGGTHGKGADAAGTTNNGTATSSGTCAAPAPGTFQSCTNWCYGGDTLVFGFSGGATTGLTDSLDSVLFNTAGTPAQNIPLTKVSHFPTALIPGAPSTIYSEIWYAHNPNLSPTPTADNASSYKGNGTGAIGATWGSGGNTCGVGQTGNCASGTILTVGTFATGSNAYPASIISIGDAISSSGGLGSIDCIPSCPTIVSQLTSTESGGALGGRGTYQLSSSQTVSASNGRNWTAASFTLKVSACTLCFFAPADTVSFLIANKTISSQLAIDLTKWPGESTGGVGRYVLSSSGAPTLPTTVASAATLRAYSGTNPAVTPGGTIYLPSTQSAPTVNNTRVAIVSGTGVFAANTMATAAAAANAATNSFTVSPAPTTALNVATLCGGTCAYFDQASATTDFSIGKPANTGYWASGFTCLSGADITPIPVTSSTAQATTWREVVR